MSKEESKEDQEIKKMAKELAGKVVEKEKKELKKSLNKDLEKEIEEKDWAFIHFVWPIALLLPASFWLWPHLPEKWLPTMDGITILAFCVAAAAICFKLRIIIKNMNSDNSISNMPSKPLSSHRESMELNVKFECDEFACKPLTKHTSSSYSSNEKSLYRHEGKIKQDKADELLGPKVTNWGGSNIETASGSDRSIVKKAPPKR